MKSDSAPGADGMTGKFFQNYWNITWAQVTREVKELFSGGALSPEWNFTQLCLLTKKPNPNQMTDLRPISLCPLVYKIISNILCLRLKTVLPQLVSQTQGDFVAGRLISDILLIAHKMIHGLRTNPNCKSDYLAIKTDLLSPFIFILYAEALVHIMAENRGTIHGMQLTKRCPSVQHILFADDSLFLCRANLPKVGKFLRCLKLYGDSSGQVIKFQKSAITFGAEVDPIMKRLIAEMSGIENEGGDGKYLGLPECFSGSKQKLLAFIGEKLNKRLKSWFAKKLSLGGKKYC